jgi:Ni,Fe-hydrogenase III large subunit
LRRIEALRIRFRCAAQCGGDYFGELKVKRQEIITDIVLTEHELQQHMRLMRGLASNNALPGSA